MRLVQEQSGGTVAEYLERVAKLVPVEIILAYLAIQGSFQAASVKAPAGFEFAIYGIMLVATPLYLWKLGGHVPNKARQVAIGTASFLVWTYGIGGTFFWSDLGQTVGKTIMYPQVAGALVTLWQLGVGLIDLSEAPPPAPAPAPAPAA